MRSQAHLEVAFFGKMEDHVSPLSSSIGGIENLAGGEDPVGAEQCLLYFLGLQEKLHPPRPPRPPSCTQGPKGRPGWEQSLKQCAGEGHGGLLASGATPPRSGGLCPSVCPTHQLPLGSWGYPHPLLPSRLRPDACPLQQHPPMAPSTRPSLQGTVPRQEGRQDLFPRLTAIWPPSVVR